MMSWMNDWTAGLTDLTARAVRSVTSAPMLAMTLGTLAGSGCVVVDHHHSIHDGTLTIDWTVDGVDDPAECRQGDTPTLHISIESASGETYDIDPDCEAFTATIDLPPDDYYVDAVLLDPDGNAATTTIHTHSFQIFEDDDFEIPIDFPADSFR